MFMHAYSISMVCVFVMPLQKLHAIVFQRMDSTRLMASMTLAGLSETQTRNSNLALHLSGYGEEAVVMACWHKSAWLLHRKHKLLKCHNFLTPHSCHQKRHSCFSNLCISRRKKKKKKLNPGCMFLPATPCFTFIWFHTFTPGTFMIVTKKSSSTTCKHML